MSEVQAPTQPQVFYSRSANLILHSNVGRQAMQDGHVVRLDEKMIEFTATGDGFGRYVTTDPEEIAYLERQMIAGGDVFDASEYNRRTTPPEVQLRIMQGEHERLLRDHNRLLAELQQQKRLPSRPLG